MLFKTSLSYVSLGKFSKHTCTYIYIPSRVLRRQPKKMLKMTLTCCQCGRLDRLMTDVLRLVRRNSRLLLDLHMIVRTVIKPV
jgi:hypothetical protein